MNFEDPSDICFPEPLSKEYQILERPFSGRRGVSITDVRKLTVFAAILQKPPQKIPVVVTTSLGQYQRVNHASDFRKFLHKKF
jgi:hypothetical protein